MPQAAQRRVAAGGVIVEQNKVLRFPVPI